MFKSRRGEVISSSPFFWQMTSLSFLIPDGNQENVFMPPFLTGMTILIVDNLLKQYIRCSPLKVELPLPFFDWMEFVRE